MNNDVDYVCLATTNGSCVCALRSGRIEVLDTLPEATSGVHAWSPSGVLAFALEGKSRVGLYSVADQKLTWLTAPLPVHDLEWVAEGVLVAAGALPDGQPLVWSRHHPRGEGRWVGLPLPPELRLSRKGVDAIVRSGDRLVAIDNIVFPKFMVSYLDVSHGVKVERTTQMINNGTYEHIWRAAAGPNVFVVASTTVGMMGSASFLTAYRFDTLGLVGSLGMEERGNRDRATAAELIWEFAVESDQLFVLRPDGESQTLVRYARLSELPSMATDEANGFDVFLPGLEFSVSEFLVLTELDQLRTSMRGHVVVGNTSSPAQSRLAANLCR